MVRSAVRRSGMVATSMLFGFVVVLPSFAVRMPVVVSEQEELEIAVGGADAVIEGFVTTVFDTFIVTRPQERVGTSETWPR